MQVYVCVICKVKSPPLYVLSFAHRQILEAIVAPSVNLTKLQKCRLLMCEACQRLIESVMVFRDTAVIGAQHLLSLLPVVNKIPTPKAPDPLQLMAQPVQVKKEPHDELLEQKSFVEIQLEPEKVETEPLTQIDVDIKIEPTDPPGEDSSATASCESDIEDSLLAFPVKKEVKILPKMKTESVVAVTKMTVPVTSAARKKVVSSVTTPRQLTIALHRHESRSATLSHARPAAGGAGRGKLLLQKLLQSAKVPKPLPKPSSSSTSTAPADKPTDTQPPPIDTKNPPWYIRVLKDTEILVEQQTKRESPEYATAMFRCESCVQVFNSVVAKDMHYRLHLKSAGEFICRICTQRMLTIDELREHRTTHSVRYFCCYCPYGTPDRDAIARHACDVRQIKWQKTTFSKNLDGRKRRNPIPFKCKICYAGLSNPARLAKHIEKHHSAPLVPETCKVCGKGFPSKFAAMKHSYVHKAKDKTTIDNLRPELFCAPCKRSFNSKSALRNHMLLTVKHAHKDNWKFQCDHCGSMHPTKCAVRTHIKSQHMLIREFKCDKCPKAFVSASSLQRHIMMHDPESRPRRHVCERCGKAFTDKNILESHLRTHSDARPHACPLCPATFKFKAALYTHNRLKHLKIKRNWKKKPKKGTKEQEGRKVVVETSDGTMDTLDGTVKTMDGTIESLDGTVETVDGTVESLDCTMETLDSTIEYLDDDELM